jgi:hypothetical protein
MGAAALLLTAASPLSAQTVPQFQVDPSWPKPLPNNWLLGQVANIAVDSSDHVWVLQRPRTLTDDEKGASLKPPRNNCCVPAPSVMEFDAEGNFVQGWGFPDTSHGSSTSTACSSIAPARSGSPATPRTTVRSSSSATTARSCC